MKTTTKKLIDILLTLAIYAFGFLSAFYFIGSVGALEFENITFGRFFIQEFHSIVFAGLAYAIHVYRSFFRHFYIKNKH
jgi:hypothetical protein